MVEMLKAEGFEEADARRLTKNRRPEEIRDAIENANYRANNGGFRSSRRAYIASLITNGCSLFEQVRKSRQRSDAKAALAKNASMLGEINARLTPDQRTTLNAAFPRASDARLFIEAANPQSADEAYDLLVAEARRRVQ